METLIAVYGASLAAIGAYALWLVAGNVRLARRLERLETFLGKRPVNKTPYAKAG
jgi:hypothetical protein